MKSRADKRLHKESMNHPGNLLCVASKCNLQGSCCKKTELEVDAVLVDSTRLRVLKQNH